MSVTVVRRLEFDAGHRLLGHEGKCRHVHGHRYAVELECAADLLDQVGRVVDFGMVKGVVGEWLDEHWDHAFLVQAGDPMLSWLVDNKQRHFVFMHPPSVEVIAEWLLGIARDQLLPYGVDVVSVRVWETPNCSAVAR